MGKIVMEMSLNMRYIICDMQILIPLWCHTDGIAQILAVNVKQYISIHDIGDS